MSASKHFDNVSEGYDNFRSRFLNFLINKEKISILNALKPKKGELILDAGCGSGFYSKLISKYGSNVIGMDISMNMILQYKKNGFNGFIGNIENIYFKKKFDKILCAGALEFTKDPNKAIKTFNQSLKAGGTLVLLYPRKNFFGYLYKTYHLFHILDINIFSYNNDLKELLKRNNFNIMIKSKVNLLTGLIVLKK